MKQKSPYRILGIVFTSIAAAELFVVLALLLIQGRNTTLAALPFAAQSPIFGGVGIGFLIFDHRKRTKRERLIANGYYETATIVAIEQNPYVRVNRQHPYRVVCRINRGGVLHEYRSDDIYHYPSVKIGDSVPVYLDRQNEKDYCVDVASIAPGVIRH